MSAIKGNAAREILESTAVYLFIAATWIGLCCVWGVTPGWAAIAALVARATRF
jgi:hypothetical protein